MSLEFRDLVFSFADPITGTQTFDRTETFDSNVIQATVAVNSFTSIIKIKTIISMWSVLILKSYLEEIR